MSTNPTTPTTVAPPARRHPRRTIAGLALATLATGAPAAVLVLPAVDLTIARIAVNHNETPGRDRRS